MTRTAPFAAFLAALLLALPGAAEPLRYRLDPAASQVAFTYTVLGVPATGTMPVLSADLLLDFERAPNSRADVVLDVTGVATPTPMASQALTGPDVLDATRHPRIRFVSRSVTAAEGGARLVGDVTIRGVTRPLSLYAQIFRPEGSAPGDRERLTVRLTGAIDRTEFGASGFAGAVDERVGLAITAGLVRAR